MILEVVAVVQKEKTMKILKVEPQDKIKGELGMACRGILSTEKNPVVFFGFLIIDVTYVHKNNR